MTGVRLFPDIEDDLNDTRIITPDGSPSSNSVGEIESSSRRDGDHEASSENAANTTPIAQDPHVPFGSDEWQRNPPRHSEFAPDNDGADAHR